MKSEFKYRSWYWYDDREGYWDYTNTPEERPNQKWELNPNYIETPDIKTCIYEQEKK